MLLMVLSKLPARAAALPGSTGIEILSNMRIFQPLPGRLHYTRALQQTRSKRPISVTRGYDTDEHTEIAGMRTDSLQVVSQAYSQPVFELYGIVKPMASIS